MRTCIIETVLLSHIFSITFIMSNALQSLNILFYKQAWTSGSKQDYLMAHFSVFLTFHESMSGQTAVTAHTPHINVDQVVIVLDRLDVVDGTKKMNFSHDWRWKSKFYWTRGWITRSKDPRCHHSPESSVGRLRRHNVRKRKNLMKGGKPYVLVEQYLLSKTMDRSGWTAIQRIACHACHEQP